MSPLTPCSCASDGFSGSLTPGGAKKADLYSSRRFSAMSEGLRPLGKGEIEGGRERERKRRGRKRVLQMHFFCSFKVPNHTTYFITSLPSSPVSSTKGEGGGEGGAPSITLLSR